MTLDLNVITLTTRFGQVKDCANLKYTDLEAIKIGVHITSHLGSSQREKDHTKGPEGRHLMKGVDDTTKRVVLEARSKSILLYLRADFLSSFGFWGPMQAIPDPRGGSSCRTKI